MPRLDHLNELPRQSLSQKAYTCTWARRRSPTASRSPRRPPARPAPRRPRRRSPQPRPLGRGAAPRSRTSGRARSIPARGSRGRRPPHPPATPHCGAPHLVEVGVQPQAKRAAAAPNRQVGVLPMKTCPARARCCGCRRPPLYTAGAGRRPKGSSAAPKGVRVPRRCVHACETYAPKIARLAGEARARRHGAPTAHREQLRAHSVLRTRNSVGW